MAGWEDLVNIIMRDEMPEVKTLREKEGFSPLDDVRRVDRDTLAKTAKAEDPSAAAAVMWTLINRSRKNKTTIPEAEALRPGQYHSWRGGDPSKRWTNYLDQKQYQEMQDIADKVLSGEIKSPIGDRKFFHRLDSPTPAWAPDESKWLKVGKHAFY
jgi:spore germination cell wall hydrolase CwlJ-like protein